MDKLLEIMDRKRRDIAGTIRPVRDHELARFCPGEHPRRLETALRRPHGLSVIAEIKRRSPSAGEIAPHVEAAEQARLYYNAGTDAISVLTDTPYFGGSIGDLWDVTDLLGPRADAPPILRKDFFIDPIQVLEAAEAGPVWTPSLKCIPSPKSSVPSKPEPASSVSTTATSRVLSPISASRKRLSLTFPPPASEFPKAASTPSRTPPGPAPPALTPSSSGKA
jgi:hypothetical protein